MSRLQCPNCGSSSGLGHTHCFKCGYINPHVKFTEGFLSHEDTSKRKQILALIEPIEFNPKKFSVPALKWLYSCGVYDNIILQHCIAYCPSVGKVLIPAFDGDGTLRSYQLRELYDSKACKYITYVSCDYYFIMYAGLDPSFKFKNTIILCEDHISGIRIRNTTNVGVLSGTSLRPNYGRLILERFDTVVFWLDPDSAGQKATAGIVGSLKRKLVSINKERFMRSQELRHVKFMKVNHLHVTKDPKYYLNSEIKAIIEAELCIL